MAAAAAAAPSAATVAEWVEGAGAPRHLEREKALAAVAAFLGAPPADGGAVAALRAGALRLSASDTWEHRLGGLRLAAALLDAPAGAAAADDAGADAFAAAAVARCCAVLEDREVRVRWAVAECLKSAARRDGAATWAAARGAIVASIEANFERDGGEPSSELRHAGARYVGDDDADAAPGAAAAADGAGAAGGPGGGDALVSALLAASYAPGAPGAGELRHGTEGWKCLETSYRALQAVVEGAGPALAPHLDADLRALVYRGLGHPNRFVREAGHLMLGAAARLMAGPALEAAAPELARRLGLGLSDNWSQVRYAASVSTRALFEAVGEAGRAAALPLLVPHMCLNRHYVAEGVRLYSQETWRRLFAGAGGAAGGSGGPAALAAAAPRAVAYFCEQARANNHAVREAACACAAELMEKVDRAAVAPHVPRLLRALVACFKDASWPVRDAACVALGRAVRAFPDEARPHLDELYSLWFAHLWDNIASVRADSAAALADAVRAYGGEAADRVCAEVRRLLPMAASQPPDSRAAGGLANATLFGVAAARGAAANDAAAHTDRTMFSCGSLAPRLGRGGGCVDHGFAREKEPWEATDGAVHAVAALARVEPGRAAEFLPGLAAAARLSHFPHCLNLQETIWGALPGVAEAMGRAAFKPHLEQFLGPLFRGLRCGHRLTEAAAGGAVGRLRDLLGPGVFAARLTEEQRAAMEASGDVPPPGGRFGAAAAARAAGSGSLGGAGGLPAAAHFGGGGAIPAS